MRTDPYLAHITLNTGHVARHDPRDRNFAAEAAMRPILRAALDGQRPALPFDDRWLLTAASHGDGLLASLWQVPWDTRTPVMSMAVAIRSRTSARLWRGLHQTPGLMTDPDAPPPPPWIAVLIEATEDSEAFDWSGGLARAIGWTWLEYGR